MNLPATKGDIAFVAAHASLAVRILSSAILAASSGDRAECAEQLREAGKQADELYATFKSLIGDAND
jgi:hypothetical protein